MKKQYFLFLFIVIFNYIKSQDLSQTIRGTIIDKQTQSPLPGAMIQLLNSDPIKACSSDENGKFRLEAVPLGRW